MQISEMQTVLGNPCEKGCMAHSTGRLFFLKDHREHTNNMGVHRIIESQPEDGPVRGWTRIWVRMGLRTWVWSLVWI